MMQNNNEFGCLKVGEGVQINGDVTVPESAFIAGEMNGKLKTKHLELEESGAVDGDVIAHTINAAGKVKGKVTAEEFLSIKLGGKVHGEIRHGDLEIQRGGSISGNVEAINEF